MFVLGVAPFGFGSDHALHKGYGYDWSAINNQLTDSKTGSNPQRTVLQVVAQFQSELPVKARITPA